MWSMADLMAVKRGGFKQYVLTFIQQCEDHVKQCEVRTAQLGSCKTDHIFIDFPVVVVSSSRSSLRRVPQ